MLCKNDAEYRVLQKLKSISQEKKQTVVQFNIDTISGDLGLETLHFLVTIIFLKKNGFIESIFDDDVLYFKVTNLGMECV